MANVKQGNLTPAPQWWKHLKDWKRPFWKAERRAHDADIAEQLRDVDGDHLDDCRRGDMQHASDHSMASARYLANTSPLRDYPRWHVDTNGRMVLWYKDHDISMRCEPNGDVHWIREYTSGRRAEGVCHAAAAWREVMA